MFGPLLLRTTNNSAALPPILEFQDLGVQQTVSWLRVPGVWASSLEEDFDFFEGLASCFWVAIGG
jgi:hypothetical protein